MVVESINTRPSINTRKLGREIGRLIARCYAPDTIDGILRKDAAMKDFTRITGIDENFAEKIRESVIRRGVRDDFKRHVIRPLLGSLNRY